MTDDYEQYEADCAKIREANQTLLTEFAQRLKESKLTEKTVTKHVDNIDFYINEFLLYEDATEPQEGVYSVNMFLGYWFIRKAMWASPSAIKSNAASLKKFYTYMHEQGLVEAEDLADLKQTIKEEMPGWIATLNRYDDPSISNMEEVWGF